MNFNGKDQSAMNNVFEELNCLVWMTLLSTILSKALFPGFVICEADIHINRASPLRQKYNGKKVTEGNFETAIGLRLGAKIFWCCTILKFELILSDEENITTCYYGGNWRDCDLGMQSRSRPTSEILR
jgi:hypothetical protein